MATFEAALVKEQGVKFVVMPVQDSVIQSPTQAGDVMHRMELIFRCPPVLLGTQSHKLLGRRDLARFIQSVGIARLPWRKWSVA